MKKNKVILNAHSVILSAAKYLFLTILATPILAGCQKASLIDIQGGADVEEKTLTAQPAITFRAVNTTDDVVKVNLPEGGDFTSVKVIADASKPVSMTESVMLDVDEALVEMYNQKNKAEAVLLPSPFYKIEDGGVISIPSGATKSDEKLVRIYATNQLGNILEAGSYVLPLKSSSGEVLYVEVTIQAKFSGRPELYTGDDCFTVFYLNTSQFDPRLVTDFVVSKSNSMQGLLWKNAIGNIVNFRSSTVDFDNESGRVLLNLSTDMRYLCDHFDTYFRPVQETGRALCLCIEGGGKGIGFCNMDDVQIDDFAEQVKYVVERYGFDGVNLWDRKSGYGKEGFPEINTTSYPKLIKELREKLGPYKLITIADYDTPTEYFWNIEAMGGIEVGKYLDYAWSGYVNGDEPVQIIDPYHQDYEYVSKKYPRKPIIGLSTKRYGCIQTTWYHWEDCGYDKVSAWVSDGLKPNMISVYYDIRSNLQDTFEGQIYTPATLMLRRQLCCVDEPIA